MHSKEYSVELYSSLERTCYSFGNREKCSLLSKVKIQDKHKEKNEQEKDNKREKISSFTKYLFNNYTHKLKEKLHKSSL